MSRIVTGLAKSRLIKITADLNDGRRMHIQATAKGRRILIKGRELRVECLAWQLSGLAADEVETLSDGVEILQRLLAAWR
jgi:DNA-binding MarR family transcriptional regulator